MTIDEAIELAAHFTGGLVSCDLCQYTPYDDFIATGPTGGYDDAVFGQWLLAQGWDFRWQEHPDAEGPEWRLPFISDLARLPSSVTWSYSLVCPKCRNRGGEPQNNARATLFIAIIDPDGEEDYRWVQEWFARWGKRVRIENDSSSDPDFCCDVEGPAEAIAEIPQRMLCSSEWSVSQSQERGGKTR